MSEVKTASSEVTDLGRSLAGKYLTFLLSGEVYGLQILRVQEIIRMMKITRVPMAPEFVKGVINLRGKVIPVICMRRKFGLESTAPTERTCIIVTQIAHSNQTITIGVIVDEVSEVMNLTPENINKTPQMGGQINTMFIMGMGKVGDNVIMLLDLDKAFSSEEFGSVCSSSAQK